MWKELSQFGKKHLYLKVVCVFFAVSSLALIALKPAVFEEVKLEKLLILTENFKEKQLDSLKREYHEIEVFDYRKQESLPDVENVQEIFILGNGIRDYDLWYFKDLSVVYLPGEINSGIIKLHYRQESKPGDRLEIKAEFLDPGIGGSLWLEDAGGNKLDSVIFASGEHTRFKLLTDLKTSGNYVFNITEKDSLGNILNRNPLPVKVGKEENLRVLILNSYPTFEIKYLKNFLAEVGHKLVVKNRITTGKFKFEFFNTENTLLGNLNKEVLEGFDLIISDSGAIRNLSSKEKNALQNAVRKDGLGILVLGNPNSLSTLGDFSVFELQTVATTQTVLNGFPGTTLERQAFQLKPEVGLEEIHTSNSSVLSAYKRLEQGRIGTTLLENTWQLQLGGKHKTYQQIWTEIVEQLSKRKLPIASWNPESTLIFKDEPFQFQLRTLIEKPRVLDENNNLIPLKQDLNNSELWTGKTYPRAEGWKQLKVEQDSVSVFNYFVYKTRDWKTLKAFHTLQKNNRFFSRKLVKDVKERMPVAINPLWFFGLFLIGMGGLWLVPKL
ncbi:hypothetical protein [Salegentibacter maritimus]|uniref:hypothetical protein n=1 Tax=Salegentibacter maritimus TaxID=2794347 RepID=UPI0018E42D38|nr:hypothetical protein [Salegentibacter maritimus]MBI6116535.1 hypothetical protein [Salegentibacter maritimus]